MAEQQVTVIVANHNYGRWIEQCLDSAAGQDYPHLQIALVDDGSTDDSVDRVVSRMTETTPFTGPDGINGIDGWWKETQVPILLVAGSPARGPSAARNIAIQCSRVASDWFQILDADDVMCSHKVSTLLAAAERQGYERVGFVYGDYDNIDEQGVMVRQVKEPFSRKRLLEECIVHSGSLINRQWLDVVGGYDESLRCVEDWDLWLRLSEYALGIGVAQSLTTVRVGSHNSTSTVSSEIWQQCWKKVSDKTHQRGVGIGRLSR